jgi:hypothetical protein
MSGTPERWTEPLALDVPPVPTSSKSSFVDQARAIVAHACLAPSGGNRQPWRFELVHDELRVLRDRARGDTLLDFEGRASLVAIGAAMENVEIVAEHAGLTPEVRVLVDGDEADLVATFRFARTGAPRPELDALVRAVRARHTNRRPGDGTPLSDEERTRITEAAETREGAILWVEERARMTELAEILAEGDRLRLLHPRLHREMIDEIRFTREHARGTGDGIDVPSMELSPTDRAVFEIVRDAKVMEMARAIDVGHGLGRPTREAIRTASAVGLLHVPSAGRTTYVLGGRAVQRAWLEATLAGLAFHPLTALLYLIARAESGAEIDDETRDALLALSTRLARLCPVPAGRTPLMIFRIARADPASSRSLRRPIDDVLAIR